MLVSTPLRIVNRCCSGFPVTKWWYIYVLTFNLYLSVLTAIFQTTYYYASHTGLFLKILLTLPVTRDCVRAVRRAVIVLTVFIWISFIGDLTGGTYIFYSCHEECDYILSPFVNYISLPKDRNGVVKTAVYVGYTLLLISVFFAHSMSVVIVYIFYTQFKKLKKNFRRSLGEQGQFNGDLSLFRRRHT